MKKITKCCKIEALDTPKGYYCSDMRGGCGKLCEVDNITPEDISALFLIDLKKLVKEYEDKYGKEINYLEFKN